MDIDIKQEFKALQDKLDTYIANQENVCRLLRKPLEEHVEDGPRFRDKLIKVCESLRINWILTLLLVGGAVTGFFYMLRAAATMIGGSHG